MSRLNSWCIALHYVVIVGRWRREGESRKVEEHADGTGDALYLYRPELEARELINARNDVHHNKDLVTECEKGTWSFLTKTQKTRQWTATGFYC
ncbi:hypothetical protein AVEN_272823-1 [Araneus ventricosus]|uniref:Uncharacterized protein n=1 Tax=Araneus ventricosus TaxID=182803 RepID=A0A4Y2SVU4_ARAVE|nr:hypothetical protein AVEN_272823-1 [Araneus ventricosus]